MEELFCVLQRVWFSEQLYFLKNKKIFQPLIVSLRASLKQLIISMLASIHQDAWLRS